MTLYVVIPFALLAIVSSLCFVGCTFDASGLGNPGFLRYSDLTVLADVRLSAYWRLNETSGTTAVNAKAPGTADGQYLSQVFPADPPLNSAAAPGTFLLGQPGLVQGDRIPPHDSASPREPCIAVNGGYVSVDWNAAIAPTEAEGFTLEAWVHVGWTDADTIADRSVMISVESTGGYKGFGIIATKDHIWQAFVGNGVDLTFANGGTLVFDTDNHVIATYAGGNLILYVNGSQSSPTTPATYVPQTAGRLFIGAGGPHLPEPKIPFVGKMQCVAIYKGALSLEDIIKHFHNGNGIDP